MGGECSHHCATIAGCLENDDLENGDLENDDLENDDLENDDLENDDLENDDLENDDQKKKTRGKGEGGINRSVPNAPSQDKTKIATIYL